MSVLFLDGRAVAEALQRAELARGRLRVSLRYLTRVESRAGTSAHRAAHEAEVALDELIAMLGGAA